MGKKGRRQGDPGGEKGDASDSSEDNKTGCPHVKKFKNRGQKGNKTAIVIVCKGCHETKSRVDVGEKTAEEKPAEETTAEPQVADEADLLMCLFCGHIGCQEHANIHCKTPRSDCHDFAFQIKKKTIWCLVCQKEVQTPHLDQTMTAWQKKIEVPSSKTNGASEADNNKNPNPATPFLNKEICSSNKKQHLVKGLMNLGNTCFFNSVLQCLAQTPYLIHVLERLNAENESCTIPGKEDQLQPLVGTLLPITDTALKSGIGTPLTVPLLNQLKRMINRDSNNLENPTELLKSLKNRYEQFQGREQHDAHELLRHLLEGVRADDLKRFQKVILEHFKITKTKDIPADTSKIIKTYGFKAYDLPLGPDILFRGELISILECSECHNTSVRTETFLDLSLPVTEEKPLPPTRKKDVDYSTGPSKQQQKKEKKEKKRAEKILAKQKKLEKAVAADAVAQDPAASNDESDTDADVEDNAEPDTSLAENRNDVVESGYSSEKAQNGDSAESVSPAESGCAEGELSLSMEVEPEVDSLAAGEPIGEPIIGCANCPEADPPEPFALSLCGDGEEAAPARPLSPADNPADRSVDSPAVSHNVSPNISPAVSPHASPTVSPHGSPAASPAASPAVSPAVSPGDAAAAGSAIPVINEIMASPTPSSTPSPESPSKESDDDPFDFQTGDFPQEDPVRSGPEVAVHECVESDLKCSPSEDGGAGGHASLDVSDLQKRLSSLKCAENASDGSSHSDLAGPSKARARSCSSLTETLATRTAVNEGECSVLSCLNTFTAQEIMSHTNKVGCDNCTKTRGKDGKTVLTNSTKQLLISAPPAILIIHLKRFIADLSRLKKMNRLVTFPMTLDLAPFCSVKCRDVKTVKPDQTEILYSLYGVVEHSGQMGGGHYVAYVKVRPALGDQDPRWNFLAPGRSFLEERPVPEESAVATAPASTEEKWYYVSDTSVSAVDEEKVKRAQAYVLFYERVV